VQLGNIYADQHEYEKSIPEYVRALELDPNLSDAHYRLGTDYVHVGQKDRAQKEFESIRNFARNTWPKSTRNGGSSTICLCREGRPIRTALMGRRNCSRIFTN